MPQLIGFANRMDCHLHHCYHDCRVDKTSNNDPGQVKRGRDSVRQKRNLAFVDNTTQDEKPCVDLYRQTCAHEPTVFGKGNGSKQIAHNDQVMLQTIRIHACEISFSCSKRRETFSVAGRSTFCSSYLDNCSRALDTVRHERYPNQVNQKVSCTRLR